MTELEFKPKAGSLQVWCSWFTSWPGNRACPSRLERPGVERKYSFHFGTSYTQSCYCVLYEREFLFFSITFWRCFSVQETIKLGFKCQLMHGDKEPQHTAGEWESWPGKAFVLEIITYFAWLWLSGMRSLKKSFLILHHFQSSGVDEVFAWAVVGTFISIENGELMSHKFSHSSPCVGFSFLEVQMGASALDESFRQTAAGRVLEKLQETMSQAWRQHQLFLLGKCHKRPAVLDTALCPPVGKFCKGNIHWVPHSPGATSHGRSMKPWEVFWFLLNCAHILDPCLPPEVWAQLCANLYGHQNRLPVAPSWSFHLLSWNIFFPPCPGAWHPSA